MEAEMPGEKSLRRVTPDEAGLAEAALAMAGGETIAYPTETQYGLGTDALNPFAVEALRDLKGKGAGPVLALVADRPSVTLLAAEVPPPAEVVARTCWPGPVTVLLPARDGIPGGLVGPEGLVGVRISSHPAAFRLTQLLGRPVVSTSANQAGQEPLHEPDRIAETFGGRLRMLVDGGRLPPGPPSTLVDGRILPLRVLREGAVSRNSLARRTHLAVEGGRPVPLALVVCTGNTCRSPLGEGVLRQLLRERGRDGEMEVASAGVSAVTWGHAMEEAREAAWEEGIDLSGHRPRQLTPELVREADIILVMEEKHRQRIAVMDPQASARVHLVKGLAAELKGWPVLGPRHIEDPIGRPTRYYRRTLSNLRREFSGGLDRLVERAVRRRAAVNGEERSGT